MSPTPVCEWNPKTDKCGIRESLLLEQPKDLLFWVFWKIGFKHFIDPSKSYFEVNKKYEKLFPCLAKGNESKSCTGQLAVCLLALEFLSPLVAESKKTLAAGLGTLLCSLTQTYAPNRWELFVNKISFLEIENACPSKVGFLFPRPCPLRGVHTTRTLVGDPCSLSSFLD